MGGRGIRGEVRAGGPNAEEEGGRRGAEGRQGEWASLFHGPLCWPLTHQLSHVDPWLSGPPAWASGPPSAVYLLDILRATWVGGTQPPGLRS